MTRLRSTLRQRQGFSAGGRRAATRNCCYLLSHRARHAPSDSRAHHRAHPNLCRLRLRLLSSARPCASSSACAAASNPRSFSLQGARAACPHHSMHPFSVLTAGIFVAGYITARWDLVTRLYELAIFAWDHGVVVSPSPGTSPSPRPHPDLFLRRRVPQKASESSQLRFSSSSYPSNESRRTRPTRSVKYELHWSLL